jgi:hypothetical protein
VNSADLKNTDFSVFFDGLLFSNFPFITEMLSRTYIRLVFPPGGFFYLACLDVDRSQGLSRAGDLIELAPHLLLKLWVRPPSSSRSFHYYSGKGSLVERH